MKQPIADPAMPGSPRARRISRSELQRFFAEFDPPKGTGSARMPEGPCARRLDEKAIGRFFQAAARQVELAADRQRLIDRRLATGFNVFDLIEPDENRLSDILAGLLDPKGDHGQGDLFLRLLLDALGLASQAGRARHCAVLREAPTYGIQKHRRRMDIMVDAGVLLAIENKVDALEQSDQVRDYLDHLNRLARRRSCRRALIYLTPDGRPPDSIAPGVLKRHRASGRLHCWSYRGEVRAWLADCRRCCEATRIRAFLADFIGYIDASLTPEPQFEEEGESHDE